jgi:GNAT superfamily N-acetyltransferase
MGVGVEWSLREASLDADADVVTALMVEYMTWAHSKLRDEYGVEDPPANPAFVRDGLEAYRQPDGRLLIAERGATAVGVGALRRLGGGIVEIKRMYVTPEARSLHIGSALLDRLIADAIAMNALVLRLDTIRFMTDAQRLYRSRGFVERSPYAGTEIPPRLQHHWLFYERPAR